MRSIADQCDGVRCDMAMLMMNDVFARTWGARVGPAPDADYWPTVIAAVRGTHPGFLFLAEAYWDLEWALHQQGFDYCYDKRLYDRLAARTAPTRCGGICTADPTTSRHWSGSWRTTTSHGPPTAFGTSRRRSPPLPRSPRPGRG